MGYIYVSKADVRKEYNWKRITEQREAKIIKYLESEVKVYDDFLAGNVWGYVVEDSEGEHIESCWGYYGDYTDDYGPISEAKAVIDVL